MYLRHFVCRSVGKFAIFLSVLQVYEYFYIYSKVGNLKTSICIKSFDLYLGFFLSPGTESRVLMQITRVVTEQREYTIQKRPSRHEKLIQNL